MSAQSSPDASVYTDRAVLAYDVKRDDEALKKLEEAQATVNKLVEHVTVLNGNEEDFEKTLGFKVQGTNKGYRSLTYLKCFEQSQRESARTRQLLKSTIREPFPTLRSRCTAP